MDWFSECLTELLASSSSLPSVPTQAPTRIFTSAPIPTRMPHTSLASNDSSAPKSNDTIVIPLSAPTTRNLPDGTVAAVVVGVILTVAIVVFVAWICVERRKQRWTMSSPIGLLTRPVHPEEGRALPELVSLTDRPESQSWIADQNFWDPRESSSQGVRSPTPKPAVAKVMSYTRAHRRAQLCYIGGRGRPVAQLHGSESVGTPNQLDISPMISGSRTGSTYHDSSRASPLFQDFGFGPGLAPGRQDYVSEPRSVASNTNRQYPHSSSTTFNTVPSGSSRNIPNCQIIPEVPVREFG
ncbi:hypothetical protein EDB81DRAFT_403464 [Dactylonectria macrodidyma]|uniref:Uncharacterized protein n=1 Tax=Dactylonectria macrodidyma TaxID=307937 RepID=A0A9P9JE73_9HYPO|nr:hypothetical protein EDB81DRAFT_403464 [Dactylonectria macrodidyma]